MRTQSAGGGIVTDGAITCEAGRGRHSAHLHRAYEHALAAASMPSRFVDVRGSRVHLLEHGEGRSVLLLHGTTASAAMFLPLLRELGGVRAVVPDRPGHGLSDPIDLPRRRFRDAAVRWIDTILDAVGMNSAALLGHSGGGLWALWYALARPERVERLVLFAPPALPRTRCPLPYRLIATPGVGEVISRLAPPTPKSMLRFARFMGEGTTLAAHPDLIDLFVASGGDRIAEQTGRSEVRAIASPVALISRSGFRHRAKVRTEELGRIAMPTLIVWGEFEPLGAVATARAAVDAIPHARLATLPTGHVPWLGQAARTAATVAEFVR
jgi:pimeloyl-ACP methyl ester carboxylesterase